MGTMYSPFISSSFTRHQHNSKSLSCTKWADKTAGRDSGMRCSLLPLIKYSWAVQSAVYCEVTYLSIAISHTRYLEWPVLCEQCFPEEALYGANCIWNYMEATFIFRLDPQTERFTVVTPYKMHESYNFVA